MRFILMFSMLAWDGRIFMKNLPNISVFSYILANFHFFQITSDYFFPCFHRSPSGEIITNPEGSKFNFQALSSTPFSWTNYRTLLSFYLLSCKWYILLFNLSLIVSSLEWVFVYELSGSGFESSCRDLVSWRGRCYQAREEWYKDRSMNVRPGDTIAAEELTIKLVHFHIALVHFHIA